ncbi:MAG: response regulator [Methylobacter sp.]|nr:response regulator [Methylobacter sp.]
MFESQFVTIIIVEDDPGHAKLIEKNLRRGGLENPIKAVENGQQALNYLKGQGNFADCPINQCTLLLLDINMPVMNGVELLRILKQDAKLRKIPVIMLTSTDDQREIDECYDLGCNLYVPKPVEFDRFSEVVRELGLMIGLAAVPSIK